MTRHLVALALLALPAVASAQSAPYNRQLPAGPYYPAVWQLDNRQAIVGPTITDGVSDLYPVFFEGPPRFSVGGGSMTGPQRTWVPERLWGTATWVIEYPPIIEPIPVEVPPVVPPRDRERNPRVGVMGPPVAFSGEMNATVVVQFPAAAEIWVGGKQVRGDAVAERSRTSIALIAAEGGSQPAEWTLTSPALKPGETHTFEVKGRWRVGGKTVEATRTVTVTAGDRKRSIVVSGTEVR
jgi:hypothetical protein